MDGPRQLYLTINVKMDLFWDTAQKQTCFKGIIEKNKQTKKQQPSPDNTY